MVEIQNQGMVEIQNQGINKMIREAFDVLQISLSFQKYDWRLSLIYSMLQKERH